MKVPSSLAMSGATTVVVGLNAALQKRFVLPSDSFLIPGNVHRADRVRVGVGGKGQNVAVALKKCLGVSNIRLAQFVGSGPEGDSVYSMLRDLLGGDDDDDDDDHYDKDDVLRNTIRPVTPMRTCTTIVSRNAATELVEPSGAVCSSDIDKLLKSLTAIHVPSAICFMGSMPPGCPDNTYARIYETAVKGLSNKSSSCAFGGPLCLIDSVACLGPLLRTIAGTTAAAGRRGPAMLKVNAAELCRLSSVKITDETKGVKEDDVVKAIHGFLKKFHPDARQALDAIAITDGSHPAYLASMPVVNAKEGKENDDQFRLFQLPICKLDDDNESSEKETVLYPIGAGDAVAGGTLAAWKSLYYDSAEDPDQDDPKVASCSLPRRIRNALRERASAAASVVLGDDDEDETSTTVRVLLAAFSFGLACGSASCLREENAVFDAEDALNLYDRGGRPTFLSSYKIT